MAQLNLYQASDLDSLMEMEERPLVFFIHTDWCKVCHRMKNTTFKNEQIEQQLNEKFYLVSLDAESTQPVNFRGVDFVYKPNGMSSGVHQLAEAVGTVDGRLSYPTVSIMNTQYEIIFKNNSFMSSEALLNVLNQVENNEMEN